MCGSSSWYSEKVRRTLALHPLRLHGQDQTKTSEEASAGYRYSTCTFEATSQTIILNRTDQHSTQKNNQHLGSMASRIPGRSFMAGSASRLQQAACTKSAMTRSIPLSRSVSHTSTGHRVTQPILSLSPLSSSSSRMCFTAGSTHHCSLYSIHSSRRTLQGVTQIRQFSTSGPVLDDGSGHHFDTHRFVEKLEREGFSRQQSEAIMNALDEVVSESMNNLTKNMVTKADQDKTVYTYKVDFAALKSELQMLEKNDFSLTNTNNERLVSEIEKLRQRLREEVARTQAGVRLDLNLEKGRIRDEAATQELKVRATEERIEQEIAALRTQMETIKLQTLQYMIGTITGAGALILAYLRMFK
ncbi:hypothetical protein EDD11_005504 [Mortierella claussenii]|nr:hypothetical protein EDD11_005504 [Mortierella claussenii]